MTFWLTLKPWLEPAAEGYPTEQAAITLTRQGEITAVPRHAQGRAWLHRNLSVDPTWWGRSWWSLFASSPPAIQQLAIAHAHTMGDPRLLGSLCLWFRGDPPALTWSWAEGLVAYITIVHRHLQAEECWRRSGRWPAEDAPHGDGLHPIQTRQMQAAAKAEAA